MLWGNNNTIDYARYCFLESVIAPTSIYIYIIYDYPHSYSFSDSEKANWKDLTLEKLTGLYVKQVMLEGRGNLNIKSWDSSFFFFLTTLNHGI